MTTDRCPQFSGPQAALSLRGTDQNNPFLRPFKRDYERGAWKNRARESRCTPRLCPAPRGNEFECNRAAQWPPTRDEGSDGLSEKCNMRKAWDTALGVRFLPRRTALKVYTPLSRGFDMIKTTCCNLLRGQSNVRLNALAWLNGLILDAISQREPTQCRLHLYELAVHQFHLSPCDLCNRISEHVTLADVRPPSETPSEGPRRGNPPSNTKTWGHMPDLH